MSTIPQTYYKDWVNSPTLDTKWNFAEVIKVQFDQGNEGIIYTVNGKTSQYKSGDESSIFRFIYAHNYGTIVHNIEVTNMSDNVINVVDEQSLTYVDLGTGDTLKFTTGGLIFRLGASRMFSVSWDTPTKNGGIININWGTVAYDKDALAKVFDRYFAYWFINDPYDEGFLNVLQEQYDLCKEQIDRHYDYIQSMSVSPTQTEKYEFGTKTKTESKGKRTDKSTYGTRDTEDKSFDYPINADLSQANPSKGEKSTQAKVEDQTEYGEQDNTVTDNKYTNDVTRVNNTDPIKAIKDADKLYSFQQYFIDCFVPCFTLFESITW